MADWQAWEREAAARALEALEAGSSAVHDALHGLLDCCLQLHPAAARHLYEAAKKDDDMFSPTYGGGHGSGGCGFAGGGPYALPVPGRAALAPHPATLPGTFAYQQEQRMARMEAGGAQPALGGQSVAGIPQHAGLSAVAPATHPHSSPYVVQTQPPAFLAYQQPLPPYAPPRHLQQQQQQQQHQQQQQLYRHTSQQHGQSQQQHQQPQAQQHTGAASSRQALGPPQWAPPRLGTPLHLAAAAGIEAFQMPPLQAQQAGSPPTADAQLGTRLPAAVAVAAGVPDGAGVYRTVSTPAAVGSRHSDRPQQQALLHQQQSLSHQRHLTSNENQQHRLLGRHAREQSWEDFLPAQPPPESAQQSPAPGALHPGVPNPAVLLNPGMPNPGSAPAANARRRASAGAALQRMGQPSTAFATPATDDASSPTGGNPAAAEHQAAASPADADNAGTAASDVLQRPESAGSWAISKAGNARSPHGDGAADAAESGDTGQEWDATGRAADLLETTDTAGDTGPAVMSLPLDVMVRPAQLQQEQQHQQQHQLLRQPPLQQQQQALEAVTRLPRAIDEVDLRQLAFGRQIGEGGFGRVYAGHWRGLPVAVKVVSQTAPLDGQLVAEFRREIATMAALPPHRHVLPLLAACTAPPHLALVTPFCARGSLYGLLHTPGLQLSWRHIVHLALGAARGMAHLHACHILHRDLKSGNLLVEADWTVRVADFGLSRVMADLHTMTGGLGTYEYMAPEVLGHQRYSEKADVYSFGVVLWEMCARAMPYPGLNGMQAALAVMNRGLRPEIPSATPAPLAELIRCCWAPAPASRPSFGDVAATLEGIHGSIAGGGGGGAAQE